MKILIDLESIKKNPDYGFTQYVPGLIEWKYSYSYPVGEKHKLLMNEEEVFVTSWNADSESNSFRENGEFANQEIYNKVKQAVKDGEIKGLTVEENKNVIKIENNEPEYLFTYEKGVKFRCPECGEIILFDSLIEWQHSDSVMYACPHCGVELNITFESLTEALKRKEKRRGFNER